MRQTLGKCCCLDGYATRNVTATTQRGEFRPMIVNLVKLIGAVIFAVLLMGPPRPKTKPSGRRRRRKRGRTTRRTGYRHHLDELIRKQGGKCGICGHWLPRERRDLIHIDHIQPIHLGGTDAKHNLRATHAKCNLSRTKSDYRNSVYLTI